MKTGVRGFGSLNFQNRNYCLRRQYIFFKRTMWENTTYSIFTSSIETRQKLCLDSRMFPIIVLTCSLSFLKKNLLHHLSK